MIQIAKRLENINEYYFSTKLQEIAALNKAGKNIINLGIGSPDMPPHPTVIETLCEEAKKPTTHQYQSYRGSEIFRNSIANWYNKFYHVILNPASEILPLIGSKEGIMHICMTFLNNGDEVLIPNPGYPTYNSVVQLAGGICKPYAINQEKNGAIDFDKLELQDLSNVKLMFVNYPHMPTGNAGSIQIFETIIAFAKKHNILVINDNPYSFILNENPLSILQIDGAMDCAIELNSLSKSLNMAGWRVGMLCGKAEIINEVIKFKSNMDSGMFLPVQLAAAKALELDEVWYNQLNNTYQKRKNIVQQIMEAINCEYATNQQGLFVWGKIPANYKDCYELSDELLYNKNVFITPGGIFGSEGNNYIRISLCQTEEVLQKALNQIKK